MTTTRQIRVIADSAEAWATRFRKATGTKPAMIADVLEACARVLREKSTEPSKWAILTLVTGARLAGRVEVLDAMFMVTIPEVLVTNIVFDRGGTRTQSFVIPSHKCSVFARSVHIIDWATEVDASMIAHIVQHQSPAVSMMAAANMQREAA